MNINFVSKFLKSTHFLTFFALVILTIYSFTIDYQNIGSSPALFKSVASIALLGCLFSLMSLKRKAYIHSPAMSLLISIFSGVFYLSQYFQLFTMPVQLVYLIVLVVWTVYQLIQVISFNFETYQIEDTKQFPAYDCIAISPFVEEYDFGENQREVFDFEFDRFTLHYKNAYASNGVLYLGKERCDFFQVISYLKETDREINDLSNDDFKLISMISI